MTADGSPGPFRERQEEAFHFPSRGIPLGFEVGARSRRFSELSRIDLALTGSFISSPLKFVERSDYLTVVVQSKHDEAEEQNDDHE